jgi:DUF971 family protein
MRFLEGEAEAGPRLLLAWDDGRKQSLSAPYLRAKCPCETCKLSTIKLEPSMFPGLSVEGFDPVGRYALQLHFSDGHRYGAYSFDLLQSLPDEA